VGEEARAGEGPATNSRLPPSSFTRSKLSWDKIHTKVGKFVILRSVLRIRIRDPGLGAFLTHPWGSGIRDGRKSASGSGIRDEQPGSCFLELRNHFFAFFGVKKILKFFDEDPGWR
jgi:hypothetical protein